MTDAPATNELRCPSDDLIAFAITEAFGERCPTTDDDCYTCQAWSQYDKCRAAATPSAQGAEVSVEATTRLADAMWQLLDDMGASGQSVCLAAKAEARIAYEPFRDKSEDFKDWMSLEAAQRLLKESEQ